MSKVYTIIVTYNGMRNDWIIKCLQHLENSSYPTEIIVVDNNSIDDTCNYISTNFGYVKLIKNNENKGFGGANNQGIELALNREADYVFLLNQDAYVEFNTIALLVQKANENIGYGIISPLHFNGDSTELDYNFSLYISDNRCKNLSSDLFNNTLKDKLYDSEFINAAAWFVPTYILKKVGGFNPSFFHYGEDDNYIHRLYYKGYKIGVYPYSRIVHAREIKKNISIYNSYDYNLKKTILKRISNPNENYHFFKLFLFILNQIKKNIKNINRLKSIVFILLNFSFDYSRIKNNLKISKSNNDFPFLNLK